MKYQLVLPLLGALLASSCSTIKSIRNDLETMEEADYNNLLYKVSAVSELVGSRVSQNWDTEKKAEAQGTLENLAALVLSDDLGEFDATDLVRSIADRYGEDLGLDSQTRRDIKDVALIINATTGPIRVGTDGTITDRERGLIVALLEGLGHGAR